MKKIILLLTGVCCLTSCEDIIGVVDLSNENVTVLAPTDNSTLNTGVINFTWETVDNATNYRIQIATPDFLNATQIVLDSLVNSTSFSKDLPVNVYQWRINAINSDYQTPFTTQSFTVN